MALLLLQRNVRKCALFWSEKLKVGEKVDLTKKGTFYVLKFSFSFVKIKSNKVLIYSDDWRNKNTSMHLLW